MQDKQAKQPPKNDDTFAAEHRQLKKIRNTRITVGAAVIAVVLLVGVVVMALPAMKGKHGSSSTRHGSGTSTSTMSDLGYPITSFFKSDGAVDSAYVNEFFANLPAHPAGFEDKAFDKLSLSIDGDVANGTITSEQGTALKQAFKKELGL